MIYILLLLAAITHFSSSSCCWDLGGDSAVCMNQRNNCNFLCCGCGAKCDVSDQNLDGTILVDSPTTIMDMADQNGDQKLNLSESMLFLSFMGVEVEEEEEKKRNTNISQWFKNMDTDNDGEVHPLELDPDFFFVSASEKNSSRSLTRNPRSPDSLWACFHLVTRGSECLGAIIDWTPCVNIAKNIFDIIHLATKEHGREACTAMIESAVSLPINAVGCSTFGLGEIAEKFTGDWVKIHLATEVALKMPGKLAEWLGCPTENNDWMSGWVMKQAK